MQKGDISAEKAKTEIKINLLKQINQAPKKSIIHMNYQTFELLPTI